MKPYIKKLYKPEELEMLRIDFKSIYNRWFGFKSTPKQSFVNYTITELHKHGYKIVKVEE